MEGKQSHRVQGDRGTCPATWRSVSGGLQRRCARLCLTVPRIQCRSSGTYISNWRVDLLSHRRGATQPLSFRPARLQMRSQFLHRLVKFSYILARALRRKAVGRTPLCRGTSGGRHPSARGKEQREERRSRKSAFYAGWQFYYSWLCFPSSARLALCSGQSPLFP